VLPLQWNHWNDKWFSCKWVFNREYLFLIPGNSPIGLRLPLDSLPVLAKAKMPQQIERSLFEDLPALDFFHDTITARYGTITVHEEPKQRVVHQVAMSIADKTGKKKTTPDKKEEPPEPEPDIMFEVPTIKTALSVEIRNGILYVFLPPMEHLEHYLDVMASIEGTAAKLQMPVR
jgi:uncharacterized protein (DUF2126 family)